jgi:hypothetical protein
MLSGLQLVGTVTVVTVLVVVCIGHPTIRGEIDECDPFRDKHRRHAGLIVELSLLWLVR